MKITCYICGIKLKTSNEMKTLKLTANDWAAIAATLVTLSFVACVVLIVLHHTGRI